MKCQDTMDLMQRFLDLDLSVSEETIMHAHLQDCPDCSDLFERLKLLSGELASLPKVTPPFSIVDSILPRLEELGGYAEPSAAADPAPMPVHRNDIAYRKEKKGFISWKIMTGVAAAGIALGMFIFNGTGRIDNKAAESILQPKQASTAASGAPEIQDKSAAPAGGVEKSASALSVADTTQATPVKEQAPSATPMAASTAKPAASAEEKLDTSMAARADPRMTMNDPYGDSAGSRMDDAAHKEPAPLLKAPMEINNAAPLAASASQITENSKKAQPDVPESSELLPESAADSEIRGLADDKDANKADEAEMGIAAQAVPSPEASPPAEGEQKQKSIASLPFAPAAALTMLPLPMVSPDGAFTAGLSNHSVTITGNDGAVLFVSSVKLNPGDTLTFIGWSEGSIFTYKITSAAGQETTYRLSAADKKEIVQ